MANHLPFTAGPAYCALPRSPETWIIEHLCPTSGLMNLFGAPKGGKSFISLQLAAAVSNPRIGDWMTFPIHTHGPVAYLQLDTPRSLWAKRVEEMSNAGYDFSNVFMADAEQAPYPFDILGSHRDPISPGWAWLREQLPVLNPVLLIVDTLREIHSGDENASDQMHNVMAALKAATHPTAVCIISHSRKDNLSVPAAQRENLLDDNRGSNYISGRMDGIIKVSSNRKSSHLTYQSRTVERATLKCHRQVPGVWVVDAAEEEPIIRAILSDPLLTSVNARASALAPRIGKTVEACRSLLRRRSESLSPDVVAQPVDRSAEGASKPSLDLSMLMDPDVNE